MLKEIISHKRFEIASFKPLPIERYKKVLNFREYLEKNHFIFEIKKSSPSKGDLNLDVDIITQSRIYEMAGAACISVLTDEKYFNGSYQDLNAVASAVNIPVLCKDFIISDIQIENAYLAGADAILLIVPVLNRNDLFRLSEKAKSLNLSILYEIHELEDYKRITHLNPELIGVNSRNFHTMGIEKEKAASILKQLEGNFLKVAESGIKTSRDIDYYLKNGTNAFLIGTTVMTSDNPALIIQIFKKQVEKFLCL